MRIPAALLVVGLSTIAVCADEPAKSVERSDSMWRLVTLHGNQVRNAGLRTPARGLSRVALVQTAAIHAPPFNTDDQAAWSLQLGRVAPPHAYQCVFGPSQGTPFAGDFNGDGHSELGVFIDGRWYVDFNANNVWDDGDYMFTFGARGDIPVVGDWNQDGKADVGLFSPNSRSAGSSEGARDVQWFRYGNFGDLPVVGDWDGSGKDRFGVYRDGVWRLDSNGDGRLSSDDEIVRFGERGDRPVVGDFNRDGTDEVGVYRNGQWILDSNGDRRLGDDDLRFTLGDGNDTPVVGDWDGDGRDQIGLVHRSSSGS